MIQVTTSCSYFVLPQKKKINQRKANFTNTRLAIYINTDVQDECIICQDVYGTSLEIFYLPCHHKFHGDCISQWLNMNASCPIW